VVFEYFDDKISEESVFKLVQQKNYRVSISMTKILHAVKGGLYYAELDFYSASSLKQQSVVRHVAPF
jgi:hypothetical protein